MLKTEVVPVPSWSVNSKPNIKDRMTNDRDTTIESFPWPGDELAFRVAGTTERQHFYNSGRQSLADLENALSAAGRKLSEFHDILDFGCGCGRVALWLAPAASMARYYGVDIDTRAIEWASENLTLGRFEASQPLPPLRFPDGAFDLVYSHSVFTHIDRVYQDLWLAELRRITRIGGLIALTTHGEYAFSQWQDQARRSGGNPEAMRQRYLNEGIVFIREDSWTGSAFPDFYHTTFHEPGYVLRHWGRDLAVRALLPRGSLNYQDFVILERTAEPTGAESRQNSFASSANMNQDPTLGVKPIDKERDDLVRRVEAEIDACPDITSQTRYGPVGRICRRILIRLLRHYSEHNRRIHRSILDVLRNLDDAHRSKAQEEFTLSESHIRLWDALQKHGERVNRLEKDLREALKDLQRHD